MSFEVAQTIFALNLYKKNFLELLYKGADKSLARPGRRQANVSVRMA